jgi:hypothetical protein
MRFFTLAASSVLAALVPLTTAQCDVEVVRAALSKARAAPENVVEYQATMAQYPDHSDIKDARERRDDVRDFYNPRKGYKSIDDAESDPLDLVDVPARFCGLTYEQCGADATWGCAGVGLDTAVNGNCTDEKLEAYGASLGIPSGVPILLGLVYLVIWPLWYILRCCCCCGGRKPGKGKCFNCCCVKSTPGNYPEYMRREGNTVTGGLCSSLNKFRLLFLILLLLCGVAALIGNIGNADVDSGLKGFIDATFYELRTLMFDANDALNQMNALVASAPGTANTTVAATDAQLCMMGDLEKTISDAEKDMEDFKDVALDIRMLVVMIAFLLPCALVAVVFADLVCKKCWWLNCLIAVIMLIPGFLVLTSAGVHLSLALLTADLCYEMDLHIKYYSYDNATKHLPENLVWVPPETLPCGDSGELNFLQQEIDTSLDKAVQGVCSVLDAKCESTDDSRFFLECDGLSAGSFGSTSSWAGSYPTYTQSCTRLTNISDVSTRLQMRDIQSDPRPVTATSWQTLHNSAKTCLAHARNGQGIAFYTANFAGAIPQLGTTPDWNWVTPYTTNENTAITSFAATAPTAAEALECIAVTTPLRDIADCAVNCAAGLPADISMKTISASLVTDLQAGANTFAQLNTLNDDIVRPLLSCKWISKTFTGLYYPMCVEANAGFINITISNLLSGIALFFAFPLAVMSTKRIKVYDASAPWKEASI